MNINITPEEVELILGCLRGNDELVTKLNKINEPCEKNFNTLCVKGFNIDGNIKLSTEGHERKTTFYTKEQAWAAQALAQLTQWYGNVDGKDKIDKSDSDNETMRYKIRVLIAETLCDIVISESPNYYYFLSFNNYNAAENFLKTHRKLLNEAKYFL
jgi:hypothetical protein